MKNDANIRQLLDRYMAAETTEQEELYLKEWFLVHKEIPAEWRIYKIMLAGAVPQTGDKPLHRKRSHIALWVAAAVLALAFLLPVWNIPPSGGQEPVVSTSGHLTACVPDSAVLVQGVPPAPPVERICAGHSSRQPLPAVRPVRCPAPPAAILADDEVKDTVVVRDCPLPELVAQVEKQLERDLLQMQIEEELAREVQEQMDQQTNKIKYTL